jgi:hypothetical protein
MEAGLNTSTVALRVVGGDEKGSLEYETSQTQSQSYVTTDSQPASLSWNKAPIWGLRPDLDYCLTDAVLLIWSALSNERTGLSFAIATGPRHRNHFWVRVPYDSWPYFTVSTQV